MENQWLNKREYIADLAIFLYRNKTKMSLQELGEHLNRNEYYSDSGNPYSETHGLGVGKLLSSTYDYYANEAQDQNVANMIALSFVSEDGSYAWNNR